MPAVRARRLALSVFAVVASSCGSGASSSPIDGAEATDPVTSVAPLTETVTQFVGDTPGGVDVLLERNGIRERASAGTATMSGEALTPGRAFRVGSVSKPFVAVMVLQLVDEGVVELDTALAEYLPGTVVGGDATIRELLSHQSGIPNYTDQPEFFADVLAERSEPITPPEILGYVSGVPGGPTGEFAYSNSNYILLGQLVEELDGADLNASLKARVTGPAGLDDTIFDTGSGSLPADLVGGWSLAGGDGDPTAPYASIATSAWSAGSLVSTAEDLAAFLDALTSGELVSSASLAEMTETGSTGYGLGLFDVSFSPTQSGYGHGGSIPGFSSTMAIDPLTGDTLVVLTNNDALIADQLAFEILTAS